MQSNRDLLAYPFHYSRALAFGHISHPQWLGVESEVTFTLSHSEPCLIVSHHTAPGVDTLFVKGAESRD
ncbi:hypothetical protein H4N54_03225, partial [Limnospira fusiformis KN01]|uniref:hypothetical protein n=1 Tax=Limnospira fusiformis TaxID=54297 RepID=UPI001CA69D74